MPLNTVSATTATTPTPAPTPTAPAQGTINADFETFLQMLTTQLQYQDPLDPMESSEFAVQLATFSGVEQQVLTNELLSSVSLQLTSAGMAEIATWIGQEVRAPAPAYFDGSPITISPNPALVADSAELVVKDDAGVEVQRFAIPVSADPIEWAGVTNDGMPLPDGVYSFEVVSYSGEEILLQEPADVYATVEEVRSEGGESILILEGGVAIPASAVSAIRDTSGG